MGLSASNGGFSDSGRGVEWIGPFKRLAGDRVCCGADGVMGRIMAVRTWGIGLSRNVVCKLVVLGVSPPITTKAGVDPATRSRGGARKTRSRPAA